MFVTCSADICGSDHLACARALKRVRGDEETVGALDHGHPRVGQPARERVGDRDHLVVGAAAARQAASPGWKSKQVCQSRGPALTPHGR